MAKYILELNDNFIFHIFNFEIYWNDQVSESEKKNVISCIISSKFGCSYRPITFSKQKDSFKLYLLQYNKYKFITEINFI